MATQWLRHFGRRTFSSLSIRNYRLYFTGQGISLCGTWMQTIGQDLLVLRLTGSGTDLGIVTALQALPVLLFASWGGLIADRFPKRRVLYVTQSCAGLLALVLGLLVATDLAQIWMVYIIALCLGCVSAIDNPTRQTFVLEMVGRDQLTNAVSLNSSEVNLARVIGPTVAGVLVATVGLAACFIINGLSYIAVLTSLFVMDGSKLTSTPLVPRAKGRLQEGFRYVRSVRSLWMTLLMMAIIGMFSYEFRVTLPLLSKFTFHGGAGSYAALTAAMGLGAVVGGIFTASRRRPTPRLLVISAAAFGTTILLAALAPTLSLAVVALLAVGFCSINFTSLGNTTLQLESDPAMRGRVMGLWTVAFMGTTPVGGPVIGIIGQTAGPRWSLIVGALAALIAAALGAAVLRRARRQIEAVTVETSPSVVERPSHATFD